MTDAAAQDAPPADVADRLEIRASIRRGIAGRKSVQEGKPDRIADLLDEAAAEIRRLRAVAAVPHAIVRVSVLRMTESCERTTYFVRLHTDEGFEIETTSYRTGHAYVEGGIRIEVPGLSVTEARHRALLDAADWSDLLGIDVDPLVEDGIVQTPSVEPMNRYEMRRRLRDRD